MVNAGKLTILSKTENIINLCAGSISNSTPNANRNFEISVDSRPPSPSDEPVNHAAQSPDFNHRLFPALLRHLKNVLSEYSKNSVWETPLQAPELLM